MRGAVMHGPGEVRIEEREAPEIVEPTDAIIRVSAACVCGSDLWPYRGIGVEDSMWPMPMGHEYAGVVVGGGAGGRLAGLAAKQLGAERISARRRPESRQKLAREFGATDVVEQ